MATIKTDTYVTDISGTKKNNETLITQNEKLSKSVKKVQKQGSSGNWKDSLAVLGNLSLAYAGATKVLGQLSQITDKYIEASKQQQLSDARLESIAKKVTKATNEQIESLKLLADKMQELTTFGDEVVQAGQSQLLSYGIQAEQAELLTGSLLDLLAATKGIDATQEDAINSANMLGKALSGQAGALSRAGIIMNDNQKELIKTGDQTERVSVLTEILADNYGGLARSLAGTDAGGIKQIENAIGDLEEEIGEELMPIVLEMKRAFLEAFQLLTPIIKGIIKLSTSSGSGLSRAIRSFREFGEEYRDVANKLSEKELQSLIIELNKKISEPGLLDTDSIVQNLKNLRDVLISEQTGRSFSQYGKGLKETNKELENLNKMSKIDINIEDDGEFEPNIDIDREDNELKEASKRKDQEIELEKEKQDLINEIREDAWNAEEERRNQALEAIQESIEVISNLQTGITDIFSQLNTNRMIEIDNEYKQQKTNINKTIKDEDKKAKALEKLDAEYENKKREQQKKTAELNKITSLFNIGINTAQAIMKAYTIDPTGILPGIVGAMGLAQAGFVAAQPIPEYATGVVNMAGVGTGTSDSNLVRLSRGESVATAAGTAAGQNAQLLTSINNGEAYTNAGGAIAGIENSIKGLSAVVANMSNNIVVVNEVNRDGLTSVVQEGNADFGNENNKTQFEASI